MSITIYYAINVFLSYYGLVLIAIGTIGNAFAFCICMNRKLRGTPTFVFLAFMAIVDTISLYGWNFNTYYMTFYGIFFADLNITACRVSTLLQGFSSQSSAFLLVIMSIERLLSVVVTNWRTVLFKAKHAVLSSSLIIFVVFSGNIYLVGTLPYVVGANSTSLFDACYSSNEFKDWRIAHSYLFSIIPFFILAFVNCLLIWHVIHTKRNHTIHNTNTAHHNKQKTMTISVLCFTFSFILMTLPHQISGGYFLKELGLTEQGRAVHFSFAELAFTYHAINFLICMLSNKRFSNEVKLLFKRFKVCTCAHYATEASTNPQPSNTRVKLNDLNDKHTIKTV